MSGLNAAAVVSPLALTTPCLSSSRRTPSSARGRNRDRDDDRDRDYDRGRGSPPRDRDRDRDRFAAASPPGHFMHSVERILSSCCCVHTAYVLTSTHSLIASALLVLSTCTLYTAATCLIYMQTIHSERGQAKQTRGPREEATDAWHDVLHSRKHGG